MLTKLTKAQKILELGSFSGYSTLCFAEALAISSKETQDGVVRKVITCEIDERAIAILEKHSSLGGFNQVSMTYISVMCYKFRDSSNNMIDKTLVL